MHEDLKRALGNGTLKKLLNQQSTYVWCWNSDTQSLKIDNAFYELIGQISSPILSDETISKAIFPPDISTWQTVLNALKSNENIPNTEIRFVNKSNQISWFRLATDQNTDTEQRIGLLTEIKKDNNQNPEATDVCTRLYKAIQNKNGLNIILSPKRRIVHIHNAGVFGEKLSELNNNKFIFDSLFEEKSRKLFQATFAKAQKKIDEEYKIEVSMIPGENQTSRTLEMVIINKENDPHINGFIIYAHDITVRKKMEKHIEEQCEQYTSLTRDYEAQNKKIRIKNEILESKNREIAQINKRLQQSENRFLSLSRIVDQAISIRENQKPVFVSNRLAEITGYPIEELYDFDINDLAAINHEHDMIVNEFAQSNYNTIREFSFWGTTKNGDKRYFSNTFYNEKIPGYPDYEFIITTDRTKEKLQNEVLRDNEVKLKATLESLQKYIIVIDNKGYIVNYYYPSAPKQQRLDLSIIEDGMHYTELPFPDEFIERILDGAIDVQQKGTSQNIELPLEINGKTRWFYINISIRYGTTGQNIGWTLVMDDITKIKATEMQLKNREAQLFGLINHFPDIVGLKDKEGRWIIANKQLQELYGIKNQPYLLKTCRELAIQSPENKAVLNKCHETDKVAWHKKDQIKYDVIFDRPNESPRSYEIIKVPVFDENKESTWLIMIGRDVTDRINMTQEIELAKEEAERADKLKSIFLTNMSHELRTPLNGILGFSQLLRNGEHSQNEKTEFLNIVWESSNLLLEIINDIIDLSRMETEQISLNIRPVNVKDVLHEAYSLFHTRFSTKNLSLNLNFPETPKQIIIDSDKVRLQQIINNLLSNAYKFTKKGTISISVSFSDHHEHLIIEVEDTGIGIDAEHFETIFERFRQVEEGCTREFGGLGLGLAISLRLSEILGGTIKLESKKSQGSKFSLVLPYISSQNAKKRIKAPPDISFLQYKTILAVEDDAGSYLLLKSILGNTGCNLLHAKNGLDAIEMIRKHTNIDVILMDVQMPIMDGLEATKKIKAIRNNLPIIAQTAHAFTNDRERCESIGCDGYITKPIKFNELFSALYENLFIPSTDTKA